MRSFLAIGMSCGMVLAACGARNALPYTLDPGTGGTGGSGAEGPTSSSAASTSASSTTSTSSSTSSSSSSSSSTSASSASSSSSSSSGTGCVPTPEVCDGIDNDCDGVIDPPGSAGCNLYYPDADHDGWGVGNVSQCLCKPGSLYSAAKSGDCNDMIAKVYPGAPEICDGLDNDCNGKVDEGGVCTSLNCPAASFNGHSYLFCQDTKTWPDALAACQSAGMSLLSINDAQEEMWVYGVADMFSTEKSWMGINDTMNDGDFVWANGDPVTYTDWEAGEPNGGTGENCGQINRFYPGFGWNDEPCDFMLRFVCESG